MWEGNGGNETTEQKESQQMSASSSLLWFHLTPLKGALRSLFAFSDSKEWNMEEWNVCVFTPLLPGTHTHIITFRNEIPISHGGPREAKEVWIIQKCVCLYVDFEQLGHMKNENKASKEPVCVSRCWHINKGTTLDIGGYFWWDYYEIPCCFVRCVSVIYIQKRKGTTAEAKTVIRHVGSAHATNEHRV